MWSTYTFLNALSVLLRIPLLNKIIVPGELSRYSEEVRDGW
jgi:hypothetical protein